MDDVANMSDDEVVKYFFDQLPKSGKVLNPDVQTSLADRVTKIRQAQTQNEATINIVAQRLKVISEFAKKNSWLFEQLVVTCLQQKLWGKSLETELEE